MAGDADKARLIAEIAAARAQISERGKALEAAGADLKGKLNVPQRIGDSYRKHKAGWLSGAALFGFLLSRLRARKKVVYVERSTGETLGGAGKEGKKWRFAKFAFGMLKPVIMSVAGQRLGDLAQYYAEQQAAKAQQKAAGNPEA
jgi:hypothetical protein